MRGAAEGGDPFVFGRGAEEAEALADAGLRFEIVPGVSSAIAGPAYAGIPVTHRDHTAQLTIFTGHEDPLKPESLIDYKQLASQPGTKVMLMGVERIGKICASLIEHGADPRMPVALVRWATTGRQRTIHGRLDTIARIVEETGFEAPAVAVFGDVVKLRDKLNWFEQRPLFGKRIVVTRTRKQAGALSAGLRALGADVFELPTIRIEPPKDLLEFGQLVQDAHPYDWIVFTSPNGVDAFFEMFYKLYDDAREIGAARIAAIGSGHGPTRPRFSSPCRSSARRIHCRGHCEGIPEGGHDRESAGPAAAGGGGARRPAKRTERDGGDRGRGGGISHGAGDGGCERRDRAVQEGRGGLDHFYKLLDGGKFHGTQVVHAGRDQDGQHRAGDLGHDAGAGFERRYRVGAA